MRSDIKRAYIVIVGYGYKVKEIGPINGATTFYITPATDTGLIFDGWYGMMLQQL